jgi:type IV secretory pathway VirJ component
MLILKINVFLFYAKEMLKKLKVIRFLFLFIAILQFQYSSGVPASDSMIFGSFGKITIYKPSETPKSVVLFISGDGGWNGGVIGMAKNVVVQGALVAGIDIRHYYKNIRNHNQKCHYPAGDFEELSMFLQKKYKIQEYLKPVLVGYSSGATLAYGILAQAPANTFKGVISLGFCPDIEINKPLCDGTGLSWHALKEGISYYLEPSEKITAPFIVLQGMKDQVCNFKQTQQYMQGMKHGELVILPKVGHGFSVSSNWLPQFITAFKKIMDAPSYQEKVTSQNPLLLSQKLIPLPFDFPITIIPTSVKDTLPFAFVISGDGGWTSFDQSYGEKLAAKGIAIVGLDAQKYFWNQKTPAQTTNDIARAIEHYMQLWNKRSFILIGYSFGADVVPFVTSNLPPGLKTLIKGVYSLSPDKKGDFEIHVADMISFGSSKDTYNVPEEIKLIKKYNPVCIFGDQEDMSIRREFSETGSKIIILPGSHHYNNDFSVIAEAIYNSIYR